MKQKIILFNPPGDAKYFRDYYCSLVSKARYYYHPVDLLYLSGRFGDYSVFVVDAIAEGLSEGECIRRITEINPDLLVFLISAPSYYEDTKFLKELKGYLPSCKFIGTGDIYREMREKVFDEHEFLDAIFFDFSTEDLISFLKGKKGEIYPNIIYRHNGRLYAGEEIHHGGTFSMPIPRWDLFKVEKYRFPFALGNRYATVLTDFGCPFQCTFCPMSTVGFKLRPVSEIIKELKYLRTMGISEIFFRDQTFGANKKRTEELCKEMVKDKLKLRWTCDTRVDVVTKELLSCMKEAGCHTIMFGIETSNEEILKKYRKNTQIKQIIELLQICKQYRIRTVGHFILGFPGETYQTIIETIAFSKKIGLDYSSFNLASPRFGTQFRKIAIEKGWTDRNQIVVESSRGSSVLKKQAVSPQELEELRTKAIREFYLRPGYLFKRLIDIRNFQDFKNHLLEAWSLFIRA